MLLEFEYPINPVTTNSLFKFIAMQAIMFLRIMVSNVVYGPQLRIKHGKCAKMIVDYYFSLILHHSKLLTLLNQPIQILSKN